MQFVMMVSDKASLSELNKKLAEEDFYVDEVSAGPNGSWLVVLDESDDYELADVESMLEQIEEEQED